jgi:hypothetical protein
MKNLGGAIGLAVVGYVLYRNQVSFWAVGVWFAALVIANMLSPRWLKDLVFCSVLFGPIAIYLHRVGERMRGEQEGINIWDWMMIGFAGLGFIQWLIPQKSFGRTVLEGTWILGGMLVCAFATDKNNVLHEAYARVLNLGPAGYIGLGVLALVVLIGSAGTNTAVDAAGDAAQKVVQGKLKK